MLNTEAMMSGKFRPPSRTVKARGAEYYSGLYGTDMVVAFHRRLNRMKLSFIIRDSLSCFEKSCQDWFSILCVMAAV